MERSKTETFIGFAVKKRAVRCGYNAAATLKRASLLILGNDISENSEKQCVKLSVKLRCPIIKLGVPLERYVHKSGVKVVAVTDENLAKAILSDKENHILVSGETFAEAK